MDDVELLLQEKLDQMNPRRFNRDRFLDLIKAIESSGGKDFSHPEMKQGIHQGHSAIGSYGLMPNTVKELSKRMSREGSLTPQIREISSIDDPKEMKKVLESNPEVEQQLAARLADKLLKKLPSEEEAAYSWNQGHNLGSEQINEREYQKHPYVQKFRRLKSQFFGD